MPRRCNILDLFSNIKKVRDHPVVILVRSWRLCRPSSYSSLVLVTLHWCQDFKERSAERSGKCVSCGQERADRRHTQWRQYAPGAVIHSFVRGWMLFAPLMRSRNRPSVCVVFEQTIKAKPTENKIRITGRSKTTRQSILAYVEHRIRVNKHYNRGETVGAGRFQQVMSTRMESAWVHAKLREGLLKKMAAN